MLTEDVARKLEDIIRQLVKDKAWDKAERKVQHVKYTQEYEKKLLLNQEKSKDSLAHVHNKRLVKMAEGPIQL